MGRGIIGYVLLSEVDHVGRGIIGYVLLSEGPIYLCMCIHKIIGPVL